MLTKPKCSLGEVSKLNLHIACASISRKILKKYRFTLQESLSKCVSPRLQNHTNENNLSPLLQHSRFKNGNRGAPSPTFIVQESACTTSSHEEVMPARLLKASNQRHNMEAKTGEEKLILHYVNRKIIGLKISILHLCGQMHPTL